MIDARDAARRALAQPAFSAFQAVTLGPLDSAEALETAALVFAADLACYPAPLQVSWPKLLYLCAGFPGGVRLYLGQSEGDWHPVGYSAWHPIEPGLLAGPWPEVVPIAPRGGHDDDRVPAAAYLFNYSVLPTLIGSPLARTLMQTLARAVNAIPVLAADTVSEDGRRAAARWGMKVRERRVIHGAPWELWARGV
jgi:hypothetical protein